MMMKKADFTISEVRSDGITQRRNRILISEPGLYELVFRSCKPEAEAFKRWITHIVIREIRRIGGFLHGSADMTDEGSRPRIRRRPRTDGGGGWDDVFFAILFSYHRLARTCDIQW
jgi:hypothetical protein